MKGLINATFLLVMKEVSPQRERYSNTAKPRKHI